MTHHTWWLASRAAGIVALLLVSASVLIGLAMASGVLRKPGIKRALLPFHEHTALAGLVAIGVHGVTLLGDAWLRPGVAGIAIPFGPSGRRIWTRRASSSYRTFPTASLMTLANSVFTKSKIRSWLRQFLTNNLRSPVSPLLHAAWYFRKIKGSACRNP